jgi:hypothetical protein
LVTSDQSSFRTGPTIFDSIVGYDGIKRTFVRSLTSEEPVHVLLVGPPGQAKTLFLTCILETFGAIGTSMNKEAGSLIKYYKTGLEEDGYKGYSTNYQDLNVDVYKEELWKLVKEILTLQGYDIQKLEDQILREEVEDNTVYDSSLRFSERQQTKHRKSQSNVQQNESLAKYLLALRILNNYVRS